jgi:microcystin-dependent protein
MALHLPNTIVNGENADAVPVEQNYSLIESYINTETIQRDGSVQMQAPLLLQAGAPTADLHAVNKDYVDGFLPVGIMLPWPSPTAPTGNWHLCDGAPLAIAAYPELYGVLGLRYGAATAGNFLLPSLVGRTLFGFDAGKTGLNVIGQYGGTFVVPVPSHAHGMPHTHPVSHTHEHPHTHSIAHNHGSFASAGASARHTHAISTRQNSTAGTTSSLMNASGVGITQADTVGNDSPDHTHTIDVPNYTGNSGAAAGATTGASSITDTGAANANTALEGNVGQEMIPPYVVVNFIIRIQ